MEFLNPTALLGLFALPLLLIPYLARRKPRRLVFSSLLLFLEGGVKRPPSGAHSSAAHILSPVIASRLAHFGPERTGILRSPHEYRHRLGQLGKHADGGRR